MKVMIVDDNAQMREFIRTVLADVASEFVECADGREAVALYEATRLITSKFPGSQIMIVTQHNHPKLRERACEAGAAGFLLKENLMDLRTALTAVRSREAQPQSEADKETSN